MHNVFDTRIFKKECVSLAKAGYRVTLIAPHSKYERVQGVDIIPLEPHRSFFERIVLLPKKAVNLARSQAADLYHFHDPELVPEMGKLAKRITRPVIWDAHENYTDTIIAFNSLKVNLFSRVASKWFDWKEIRLCQHHFAGVVTINEEMAGRYHKHGISTCVISNYADIDQIIYPPIVALSSKPRLISTGAQFPPRKIYEIAQSLDNIRQSIDAEVAFCGSFPSDEIKSELRSRVSEQNTEHLIVEGPFEWLKLVNEIIPKAWVACVLFDTSDPNNCRGLPNRFFECWAAGVPVIATKGTKVAELVERENGGIVIDENTPEQISRAFIEIVTDKEKHFEMSRAGRAAVEEKYNWNSNFADLISFYHQMGVGLNDLY